MSGFATTLETIEEVHIEKEPLSPIFEERETLSHSPTQILSIASVGALSLSESSDILRQLFDDRESISPPRGDQLEADTNNHLLDNLSEELTSLNPQGNQNENDSDSNKSDNLSEELGLLQDEISEHSIHHNEEQAVRQPEKSICQRLMSKPVGSVFCGVASFVAGLIIVFLVYHFF